MMVRTPMTARPRREKANRLRIPCYPLSRLSHSLISSANATVLITAVCGAVSVMLLSRFVTVERDVYCWFSATPSARIGMTSLSLLFSLKLFHHDQRA